MLTAVAAADQGSKAAGLPGPAAGLWGRPRRRLWRRPRLRRAPRQRRRLRSQRQGRGGFGGRGGGYNDFKQVRLLSDWLDV